MTGKQVAGKIPRPVFNLSNTRLGNDRVKSNIIAAALVGLVLGVIAELFFAFVDQLPVLGCLATPLALLVGLGLPIFIGWLAAAWGPRGVTALLDGALAALTAEIASRVLGFCASLLAARSFFIGSRFLLPSVEPAARALFAGVWDIVWFVVALVAAVLLGALGALVYNVSKRP